MTNLNHNRMRWILAGLYPAQGGVTLSFNSISSASSEDWNGKTDLVTRIVEGMTFQLQVARQKHDRGTLNRALDQMADRILDRLDKTYECGLGLERVTMLRLGHEAAVTGRCGYECTVTALRARGMRTFEEMVERADIICMTCSGAAMRRFAPALRLLEFGAVIVEEAGKITQPEAIPFLSYNPQRLVLVGDHFQLPPVVTNALVRTTTRLDISFLAHIVDECQVDEASIVRLDWQGRAVPIVCNLYRWRYANFQDLGCAINAQSSELFKFAASCRIITNTDN